MSRLSDPERLQAYQDAIANWRLANYVEFQLNTTAARFVEKRLGVTYEEIAESMSIHVAAGHEIDEVRETRPLWSDRYEFHYDLRLEINDLRVYIETRLRFKPPYRVDESTIIVVNIHDC